MSLPNEVYYEKYGALNRRLARARQRAYRELARRHAEEFDHLLIVERALVEADDEPHPGPGRPRKVPA